MSWGGVAQAWHGQKRAPPGAAGIMGGGGGRKETGEEDEEGKKRKKERIRFYFYDLFMISILEGQHFIP